MKDNQLSSLEQLRKLVAENPVLQQQLQELPDLPSAMEAVRHFAEQRSGDLDIDQIVAGLSQASHACHASNVIPDAQLEGLAAGADPLKIFLAVITFGITAAVDADVEARRKYAEGYGG
jgi:hypothetical protein